MLNHRICKKCSMLKDSDVDIKKTGLRQLDEPFLCKRCGSSLSFDFELSKENSISENKLLIINGPFCSDKGLVGDYLAQEHGFIHISAYEILKEKRKKDKLLTYNDVHADVLWLSHKLLLLGKKVVLTQTILPSFWLLYEYYFKEYYIDSNMVILLPELNDIYTKNDQLIHSFDEEFLEKMYHLFLEEEKRVSMRYQYEAGILPECIARDVSNYFYPNIQAGGLLKTHFADIPNVIQKIKEKIHFFSQQKIQI